MYIEPGWQDRFPDNDFKGAVSYLDSFDWNLSFHQSMNKWLLIGGDQLIATFNTQEELEAFTFGMAFGFATLPDEVIDHILKVIRD